MDVSHEPAGGSVSVSCSLFDVHMFACPCVSLCVGSLLYPCLYELVPQCWLYTCPCEFVPQCFFVQLPVCACMNLLAVFFVCLCWHSSGNIHLSHSFSVCSREQLGCKAQAENFKVGESWKCVKIRVPHLTGCQSLAP